MSRLVGSEGIFSGAVGVCLQSAVGSVSHHIALCRTILAERILQQTAKGARLSGVGTPMIRSIVLFLQLWHAGHHLNRIHFENTLHSVCCDDPSLDVYFISVWFRSIVLST